jgi:hypothetical protein
LIVLMLAYGILANSLGLALATWVRRFGVAVGLTVAIYVVLAVGPILLLLAVGPISEPMRGFASVSPWYGVGETTAYIDKTQRDQHVEWKIVWILIYIAAGLGLLAAVQRSFDRCIGRVRA